MHYSTAEEFYGELLRRFASVVKSHGLLLQNVEIHAAVLTPEEAIGTPGRTDYPILEGKDQMLQAVYNGSRGQVFTDSPAAFTGSLADLLKLDAVNDRHARGLFIAGMNAVMRSLGLIEGSVHCRNDGMERCAETFNHQLEQEFGQCRICQIGYQPALAASLAGNFPLRVLDLNPQNIGKVLDGVSIENGSDPHAAIQWADLILCTGSTLANGTIIPFLNMEKTVIFYGTTIAGAAELFGLRRMCFNSL